MDESEDNKSLTDSYFLSSTTSSYNGLLGDDCTIKLDEILSEYKTILSVSRNLEKSENIETKRTSIILAGSHLINENCWENERDISQTRSVSKIGNFVNRFSLSRMSFCMEKIENSIYSEKLNLIEESILTKSDDESKILINKIPINSFKNVKNESNCEFKINNSYYNNQSNYAEYKKNLSIPNVIITQALEENQDENLKNEISDNFFIRKKKIKYFLSPHKLINSCERIKHRSLKLSPNVSSHLTNVLENLDEEKKFYKIADNVSSNYLQNITPPRWPSFDNLDTESEIYLSDTSTPLKNKSSLSQFFGSPVSPIIEAKSKLNSPLKFDFGVSGIKYFSRRKGLKYFSSPKK